MNVALFNVIESIGVITAETKIGRAKQSYVSSKHKDISQY